VRRRWPLIGLVVAVAALIDLVVLPRSEAWRGPEWRGLLAFSMAPSHGSLLGLWAALGGRATPWRLVMAFVGVVTWIWALGESDLAFWVAILLVQMVSISALLLLARLLGLELSKDLRPESAQDPAAGGQWVQYSVRSLLSWTAACAVLLGTLHYVPVKLLTPFSEAPAVCSAIILSSTLSASGSFWICLGGLWPHVRVTTLGLTAAAGVATLGLVIGSRGQLWEFVVFCLSQVIYLVGSLWLIRLAGYRLVWRRWVRL
jgi:hypothetical protein